MMEELETEIEGILINGVDIIKFSDDGRLIMHRNLQDNDPRTQCVFSAEGIINA
jgi:hypothetical protein